MEETGCEIISGAPTTLAIKGQMKRGQEVLKSLSSPFLVLAYVFSPAIIFISLLSTVSFLQVCSHPPLPSRYLLVSSALRSPSAPFLVLCSVLSPFGLLFVRVVNDFTLECY